MRVDAGALFKKSIKGYGCAFTGHDRALCALELLCPWEHLRNSCSSIGVRGRGLRRAATSSVRRLSRYASRIVPVGVLDLDRAIFAVNDELRIIAALLDRIALLLARDDCRRASQKMIGDLARQLHQTSWPAPQ